jgi:Fe2+ or Zn2+ uptake regulation protein
MKHEYDYLLEELKKRRLSISQPRRKVMEFLCQKRNHPTAEQIFAALQGEMPGLSRTTVYNTLHLLADIGLVRVVGIEENETRYDVVTKSHGHFKCVECGEIFDFCYDVDAINAEELKGFAIVDRGLYFKGVCPKCQQMKVMKHQ